jgi:hypothetical protein
MNVLEKLINVSKLQKLNGINTENVLIKEPEKSNILTCNICINENKYIINTKIYCSTCRLQHYYIKNREKIYINGYNCYECRTNNQKLPQINFDDIIKINDKIVNKDELLEMYEMDEERINQYHNIDKIYIKIENNIVLVLYKKGIKLNFNIDKKDSRTYYNLFPTEYEIFPSKNGYVFKNIPKIYKNSIIKYKQNNIILVDKKKYYEFTIENYKIIYNKIRAKNFGDCFNSDTIFRFKPYQEYQYGIYNKKKDTIYKLDIENEESIINFDYETYSIDETSYNSKNLNSFFSTNSFFTRDTVNYGSYYNRSKKCGEFFCKNDKCFKASDEIIEGVSFN